MKNLRYLGIQGWHAPSYRFRHFSAQLFRDVVEAMTGQQALLVSSMYRTDLFYSSSVDINSYILKLWCIATGHDFGKNSARRFIAAYGEQEIFGIYFESMGDLRLHNKYFQKYKNRLKEVVQKEPNNIILKELMECDLFLAQKVASKASGFSSLTDQAWNFQLIPTEKLFRDLSDLYIRRPFLN